MEIPVGSEAPQAASPPVSGDRLIGRTTELAWLLAALEESIQGRGRVVLVSGEPGIGKTRLADEFSAAARDRGARVLWGRCWEAGGSPAYWPWVQSIRSYTRDVDPDELRILIEAEAPDIARMLPEVRGLFDELAPPPDVDPETARFRLFDAVTTVLTRASQRQPLVVILDDLHAADTPSLLLLRFLGNELDGVRIMVVGLYRGTDLDPHHLSSSEALELARLPGARYLSLSGITASGVAELITITAGRAPTPDVAAIVHARTGGNPLFVSEVARFLAGQGDDGSTGGAAVEVAVPAGIREVIGRRVARLSEGCAHTLTLASVLGREFDLIELGRVTGKSTDQLLDDMEEAAAVGIITDVPGVIGRLRFSHALVRDSVYSEIPAARRIRLHDDIGSVLEALYRDDIEGHLSELAHHFVLAAPGGDVERAVGYAKRAGERALRLLAYEEAVRLIELALEALGLRRPVDLVSRCDLLLALGDAEARAGREANAKRAFLDAADIAERLAGPHRLARAALGYGGRFVWARAGTDQRLVPLLEVALAALGKEESDLRVRVMARLAGALRDEPSPEPRASLSQQALALARRLGDPAALAYALDGRYAALLWPENARERIEIANELERVAESGGDAEAAIQARCYRSIALLELGDVPAVNVELAAAMRQARELGQRAQIWLVTAMEATVTLFQGRFAAGRHLMDEALASGEGAQRSDALLSHRIHSFTLDWFLGGVDGLEEILRRSIQEYPRRPMFRCMLGSLYVSAGRQPEAHRILGELAENDFASLPRSNEWLFSVSILADVAVALGDAARASTLYELLLPFAGRNGATADYISTGSVARYLGILATTMRRWDEAERWNDIGLEANRRMGALPFVAFGLHDRACLLVARALPGDAQAAGRALEEALDLSQSLGLGPHEARVRALRETIEPSPISDEVKRAPPRTIPRPNLFRREGEYWLIVHEEESFRLRDLKGLRYLAHLLAEPGREFHAVDLVMMEAGGTSWPAAGREPGMSGTRASDAGPLLDAPAKEAYRARLRELETDIESARGLQDPAAVAGMEREREFLVSELARAVGLGGRDRRAAAATERARVSVTRAIRSAVARIRGHGPGLADHLDRTIRTGTFCSYQPDPRLPAAWHVRSSPQ